VNKKNGLNFGSHQHRDQGLTFCERFFNTARRGIFPQFCSYL